MSERTVRLDIGAQANTRADSSGAHAGSGGLGEQAAEEHVDRFRRALAGADEVSASSTTARSSDAQTPNALGAFGLFGGMSRAPQFESETSTSLAPGRQPVTSRLASEVADRILVSADADREARIFIREDVLPGVEVRITQEHGRWLVEFAISDARSFEILDHAGEQLAGELAERLRSDVEVRLVFSALPGDAVESTYFAAASGCKGDTA
ncbi:hypothetical protein [Peristeroidobacter soli]|uniref:hypothetical protein n=1 Tax=Peristeroidobacter soli TaxID=2497877 RepID=UPI00101CE965|nr:hypothetical protein [Peristeroidobacter soli]